MTEAEGRKAADTGSSWPALLNQLESTIAELRAEQVRLMYRAAEEVVEARHRRDTVEQELAAAQETARSWEILHGEKEAWIADLLDELAAAREREERYEAVLRAWLPILEKLSHREPEATMHKAVRWALLRSGDGNLESAGVDSGGSGDEEKGVGR